MSTPLGQGIQYPQPVQGAFTRRAIASFTSSSSAKSSRVICPGRVLSAMRQFSSTISRLFMPDSTQVTSGWSHSQRSAHSAGVQGRGLAANSRRASSGSRFTSLPPRSGSMMITGSPRAAAACSPARPAWLCSST